MNRAFLIIGIPALVTSFCWLWFGWGLRVAAIGTGLEFAAACAGILYVSRRQKERARNSEVGS